MFLEKCVALFFHKMRPSFFFILLLLPFLGSGLILIAQSKKVEELEFRFEQCVKNQRSALEKRERKERFLARYSSSSPYFLNEAIEPFVFLAKETASLKNILSHPAYPKTDLIQKRLQFLEKNRLRFKEEKVETFREFKQTQEKMEKPIELDEQELTDLLHRIEDPFSSSFSNRPQLLVKELFLKKQKTPLESEVFEMQMQLIKREFQ